MGIGRHALFEADMAPLDFALEESYFRSILRLSDREDVVLELCDDCNEYKLP